MRNTNRAVLVILTAFSSIWPAIAFSQQSKVIELAATNGGEKLASIRLNDQNLLFEPAKGSDAYLFTPEALITIKHNEKTYSIQNYDDLLAMVSRRAGEITKSPETRSTTGAGSNVALRLTSETETIFGLRVCKVIKTRDGKLEDEMWVSIDLVPTKLRAAGERFRSVIPQDYWEKVHGNPGMVEIIMMFGIPIKIVSSGHDVFQARVLEKPISSTSFQVPSGYRKTAN